MEPRIAREPSGLRRLTAGRGGDSPAPRPGAFSGWIPCFLLAGCAAFLLGAAEKPASPALLSPAESAKQGEALAKEIVSQRPAQNTTNSGVLTIRSSRQHSVAIPVEFEITATKTHWSALYETAGAGRPGVETLTVVHADEEPNQYSLARGGAVEKLAGNETMTPFAGSDFWVADLGLEFFHWPAQRLLKSEMRRGRSCRVLESLNPHPSPGAYSRVVTWIDTESDGIVFAEAYDFKGARLKEFAPKDFQKVRGQWQLKEMEIDNVQTGSRTRIDFNLGANPAPS